MLDPRGRLSDRGVLSTTQYLDYSVQKAMRKLVTRMRLLWLVDAMRDVVRSSPEAETNVISVHSHEPRPLEVGFSFRPRRDWNRVESILNRVVLLLHGFLELLLSEA